MINVHILASVVSEINNINAHKTLDVWYNIWGYNLYIMVAWGAEGWRAVDNIEIEVWKK